MSAIVFSGLYPPVINSYLPAFVIPTSGASSNYTMSFKISDYNNSENFLKSLQYRLTDSQTGKYILETSAYILDTNKKDCSFTISDFGGEPFKKYNNYKLQVRLIVASIPVRGKEELNNDFLEKNSEYLTEWSSVCLISFIGKPTLSFENFELNDSISISEEDIIDLKGKITYDDETTKDWLIGYKITLKHNNQVLLNMKDYVYNYNNTSNSFEYTFTNAFEPFQHYDIYFSFITNSLYEETNKITLFIVESATVKGDLTIYPNSDTGSLLIKIDDPPSNNIILRRSSSETNYQTWYDIIKCNLNDLKYNTYEYSSEYQNNSIMVCKEITENKLQEDDVVYCDNTVKSGVNYKYYINKVEDDGTRKGKSAAAENFVLFDDIYLSNATQTLIIKYDSQISGYKRNILDIKTETLGSKYPYIRRNGAVDYKQVTINGLISYMADNDELFCKKDALYANIDKDRYINNYCINPYNDIIAEREFREKVIDFLYKDEVKLFRSTQEGNLLVRLMDITLTPNAELGRLVYSFSCTAYEIAEDTPENYKKYNLIGG